MQLTTQKNVLLYPNYSLLLEYMETSLKSRLDFELFSRPSTPSPKRVRKIFITLQPHWQEISSTNQRIIQTVMAIDLLGKKSEDYYQSTVTALSETLTPEAVQKFSPTETILFRRLAEEMQESLMELPPQLVQF